jgi:hypothetical protein
MTKRLEDLTRKERMYALIELNRKAGIVGDALRTALGMSPNPLSSTIQVLTAKSMEIAAQKIRLAGDKPDELYDPDDSYSPFQKHDLGDLVRLDPLLETISRVRSYNQNDINLFVAKCLMDEVVQFYTKEDEMFAAFREESLDDDEEMSDQEIRFEVLEDYLEIVDNLMQGKITPEQELKRTRYFLKALWFLEFARLVKASKGISIYNEKEAELKQEIREQLQEDGVCKLEEGEDAIIIESEDYSMDDYANDIAEKAEAHYTTSLRHQFISKMSFEEYLELSDFCRKMAEFKEPEKYLDTAEWFANYVLQNSESDSDLIKANLQLAQVYSATRRYVDALRHAKTVVDIAAKSDELQEYQKQGQKLIADTCKLVEGE